MFNRMKNVFLLAFIVAGFIMPNISSATHIVGGDMTYKCLGDDQYEITLTFRRDCVNGAADAPLDDPATIAIYDIFGSLQTGLGTLGRYYVPVFSRTILDNSVLNCAFTNGNDICVEEAVYKVVITIPSNSSAAKLGYYIAYQRCCRNSILNNIEDPLETGSTYYTCISPQAIQECNSQPDVESWPPINICVGEKFSFDHSTTDPDGDELVYRLCTPSLGASIDDPNPQVPKSIPPGEITWGNGYDENNPLGPGSSVMLDPNTGILMATPSTQGTYLFGVCVDEYRNGVLLSTVRRDFQYNVLECTDPVDIGFDVNGDGCDGNNSVSFVNNTVGADTYTWFFDYPNTDPAFTSTAISPTFTYPAPGTYLVRLEATRASDDCTVIQEVEISVGVTNFKAEFGAYLQECSGSQVSVLFQDETAGVSGYDYEWTINGINFSGSSVSQTFTNDEIVEIEYTVTAPNGCQSNLSRSIKIEDLITNGPQFDLDLVECNANGNTIMLTNPIGGDATWTITVPGSNPVTLSGSAVEYTFSGQQATISMEVDNGCYEGPATQTIDLQDLINAAFDVRLLSCTSSGNLFAFTNLTTANANWSISDGSTVINQGGDIVTALLAQGTFTVTLELDNDCYGTISKTFNSADFTEPDFDVVLVACTPQGDVFNFINPAGTVADWTIVDGNSTVNTSGHSVTATIDTETFSVTMDPLNGCSGPITKQFRKEDFYDIDFDIQLVDCGPAGDRYQLTTDYDGALTWTISDNTCVIFTSSDSEVIATVPSSTFTLSLETDDECIGNFVNNYNRDQFLPTVDITDNTGGACLNPNGQDVLFSAQTGAGVNITATEWSYNVNGGAQQSANGQSISVFVSPSDIVNLNLIVTFANGCTKTVSRTFRASEQAADGNLAIGFDRDINCISANGENVTLLPLLSGTTSPITSYAWSYSSPVVGTSSDQSVVLPLSPGQLLDVTLTVVFANGCTLTASQRVSIGLQPDLDINERIDCSDPDETVITLSDVTNLGGLSVTSYNWTLNGTNAGSGQSITFSVIDAPITATLNVVYSNGCTGTFTRTYRPEDFIPTLEYDVERSRCENGIGFFQFSYTGFVPECLDITSIEWIIDGMTYTGSPVIVQLPLDGGEVMVGLTVTFSNGTVLILDDPLTTVFDPGLSIDQFAINIVDLGSSECGDSINLAIDPFDPNLDYTWSTDPDFNVIVGSGEFLVGSDLPGYNGTIYVETEVSEDCRQGSGTITLEDNSIKLAYDEPFIVCPGDTTTILVENLDPDQVIEWVWKDADGLISGQGTNMPEIAVPDTQLDDIQWILCSSNQFGCTRTDTINIRIGTEMDIPPFTYEPDSCGSFTINFMGPDPFDPSWEWEFGDGNTSSEQDPVHTYNDEGTYTVTLSSLEEVCGGEGNSQEITVPALPMIMIMAPDTIICDAPCELEIDVETNTDPTMVRWCDEDGNEIGAGTPLVYTAEMDTTILTAKTTDQFGCENSDMVVIVRNVVIPPDIFVSGNDIICPEDETVLTVEPLENPEDYTFDWSPDECIVSGDGSQSAIVTSTESKTISVLVTRTGTGIDTTIFFDVIVDEPVVGIFPDNGIESGAQEVCQGSEIDLSADPFDSDCNYLWSNGENGGTITVSPMESTTFSVTCTNANNCVNSATIDLTVIPPQCNANDVFVPNAFSPNGDSVNDRLFVRSKFIKDMEFFVVNRWGQEVWRTTNQDQGWDGSFEGEELAPDVYAYCLIVTCVNDVEFTHTGNVSIIK